MNFIISIFWNLKKEEKKKRGEKRGSGEMGEKKKEDGEI